MALTKHQTLARGIKSLLTALNAHYQKTASLLDVIQFHFYEPFLIMGRPLMKERALQAMMHTHRCGLGLFSSNAELKMACKTKPLIGCIITPPTYPESHIFQSSPGQIDATWWIPWGVKIQLPSHTLSSLHEAFLEAILYCASEAEMSEWIDWFEHEDKAITFTNQFLSILAYEERHATLKRNLAKLAFPFFDKSAMDFFGKSKFQKVYKTINNAPFAPKEGTSIAQAYELVSYSLKSRKKRYLDDFKREWRNQLEKLIFENLDWSAEEKESFLREWIPQKPSKEAKIIHTAPRWQSSLALDRQTYASFIKYFAEIFLQNPSENQSAGEIVILLWLMVYIAQEPYRIRPVKELLELSNVNIQGTMLIVNGIDIELSLGLSDLLKEYIGDQPLLREKKLFSNLNMDMLEDAFRRASMDLLPPDSTPALPEAFLTFPHPYKHARMIASLCKHRQTHPPEIHHHSISRHELRRQLLAKSPSKKT